MRTITLTGGSGGIALNAAVGAGAGTTGTIVDLMTTGGGDVTEAPGSGITAAELIGNVSGSVTLDTLVVPGVSNNIAALGAFTVNGSGGFYLNASGTGGTLTVNGPLTATTGPLTIWRPHALAVPGTITANALVELDDFGGGTTITGNVKSPTILLVSEISGNISLSGNSSIGQSGATVTLDAGVVNQDSTSVISAGTLQVTFAAVNLLGTGNAIDTLGPVTSLGLIHLIDSSALTVSGPINLNSFDFRSDVFLQSAKNVTVNTPIAVAAAPVTIQAGGNLLVAAGAPISTPGTISLAAADPTIAGFNPGGKLTLNSDVGTSAGTVQLSAGSGGIALGGKVSGTAVVDLSTTGGGPISQTAAAIITAGTLTGSSSGAVDLSTAANAVSNLGAFSTGGNNFALNNDTNNLQIIAPVSAAAWISLSNAGPITQTAAAAITAGTLTGSSSGT